MNIINDVAKFSKTLMFKEPFYGLFLISLNKRETKELPTAAVGKNNINTELLINPEFWTNLDDKTKLGILKHELLHIAFFHLTTVHEYDDHLLHNIAADLEINQYIQSDFKGEKWDGLELTHYPELNLLPKKGTRYYYEMLKKINNNRKQPSSGEMSKEDLDDILDQIKNGSKNDGLTPETSKIWDVYDAMKRGEQTVCSHDTWKEFYDGLSEADRKLLDKQVNYQLKEIAEEVNKKDRGLIPGELKSHIDSLFEITPPVLDWKAYIRRFGGSSNKIYTKKTRHKQSKRYEDNPALKIKNKKHLLIGIDTSGSVSDSDLLEFFNEIHHIYKTGTKVTIVECDARIHQIYEYKGKVPSFVKGRGGTSMSPIINHYNDNWKTYSSLILLTDGECEHDLPKPRTQMLWVICSTGTSLDNINEFPGLKIKISNNVPA